MNFWIISFFCFFHLCVYQKKEEKLIKTRKENLSIPNLNGSPFHHRITTRFCLFAVICFHIISEQNKNRLRVTCCWLWGRNGKCAFFVDDSVCCDWWLLCWFSGKKMLISLNQSVKMRAICTDWAVCNVKIETSLHVNKMECLERKFAYQIWALPTCHNVDGRLHKAFIFSSTIIMILSFFLFFLSFFLFIVFFVVVGNILKRTRVMTRSLFFFDLKKMYLFFFISWG